jgi:hypothetical protein
MAFHRRDRRVGHQSTAHDEGKIMLKMKCPRCGGLLFAPEVLRVGTFSPVFLTVVAALVLSFSQPTFAQSSFDGYLGNMGGYIRNNEQQRSAAAHQSGREATKAYIKHRDAIRMGQFIQEMNNVRVLFKAGSPLLAASLFSKAYQEANGMEMKTRTHSYYSTSPDSLSNDHKDMLTNAGYHMASDIYDDFWKLLDKIEMRANEDLQSGNDMSFLWHQRVYQTLIHLLYESASGTQQNIMEVALGKSDTAIDSWKTKRGEKEKEALDVKIMELISWEQVIEGYLNGNQSDAMAVVRQTILRAGGRALIEDGTVVTTGRLKQTDAFPFSIDRPDVGGRTCLHLAVSQNDAICLAVFQALGANTNIKDRLGKTAFDRAAGAGKEYFGQYSLVTGWSNNEANRSRTEPKVRALASEVFVSTARGEWPSDSSISHLEDAWADLYLYRIDGDEGLRKLCITSYEVLLEYHNEFVLRSTLESKLALGQQFADMLSHGEINFGQLSDPAMQTAIAAHNSDIAVLTKARADATKSVTAAAATFGEDYRQLQQSWGHDGVMLLKVAQSEATRERTRRDEAERRDETRRQSR